MKHAFAYEKYEYKIIISYHYRCQYETYPHVKNLGIKNNSIGISTFNNYCITDYLPILDIRY